MANHRPKHRKGQASNTPRPGQRRVRAPGRALANDRRGSPEGSPRAPVPRPVRRVASRAVPRTAPTTGKPERLQKVLAQAGLGSRRGCEELVLQGRVTVNGEVVRQLGTRVDPATSRIAVDGEPIRREPIVYFAVNKPKGYVSTNFDPSGRPRVVRPPPRDPRAGLYRRAAGRGQHRADDPHQRRRSALTASPIPATASRRCTGRWSAGLAGPRRSAS